MTVGQLRRVLRYLPEDAEVVVAIDGACVDAGFVSATHVSLMQVQRVAECCDNQARFIKRGFDESLSDGPQAVAIGDKRGAIELLRLGCTETPDAVAAVDVSDDGVWSAADLIPKAD